LFFQAEDGIRAPLVTGVQTCALPISAIAWRIASGTMRASAWYRDEGIVPEAIRHAIAAGDVADAAELIAADWLRYVNRGELETEIGRASCREGGRRGAGSASTGQVGE